MPGHPSAATHVHQLIVPDGYSAIDAWLEVYVFGHIVDPFDLDLSRQVKLICDGTTGCLSITN